MNPDTVIKRIENVDIQGATNIAREGVKLLQHLANTGTNPEQLDEVSTQLKQARPTEPFLRNAIDIARESHNYEQVLAHINGSQIDIQEHSIDLLSDDPTVYTHCHSSTVTGALQHAHKNGGAVTVRATETRPLYQGRTTAQELAENGIPVQLYVDSGAQLALEDADAMMIGADAVLSDGTAINKIGSGMFARIAQANAVPVYILTDSWKFDPATEHGDLELRDPEEVWKDRPEEVTIKNYAFEPVTPEHITGIVSELGVHEPDAFSSEVRSTYPALDQ